MGKSINECHVYSDFVEGDFILPQRKKYSICDVRKARELFGSTFCAARFIVICSAIYHYGVSDESASAVPSYMMTGEFLEKCKAADYFGEL